jgi:hypothetical protein
MHCKSPGLRAWRFRFEDVQWTLATWMQVEALSYYRVQVRSRKSSAATRFVAFYESAQQSGYYAELGCGRDSVALTNLQAPAPWDDAMLDLVIAAEHENAKRALVASERVSG